MKNSAELKFLVQVLFLFLFSCWGYEKKSRNSPLPIWPILRHQEGIKQIIKSTMNSSCLCRLKIISMFCWLQLNVSICLDHCTTSTVDGRRKIGHRVLASLRPCHPLQCNHIRSRGISKYNNSLTLRPFHPLQCLSHMIKRDIQVYQRKMQHEKIEPPHRIPWVT